MNLPLLAAALLVLLVSGAHSYLGERYILIRLFRRTDLPKLFGSDEFTRATLRFAWHITSVAWLGLAALILLSTTPSVAAVIAATFGTTGLIALVGSKGRHLSWIVFFAIAALVWFGRGAVTPVSGVSADPAALRALHEKAMEAHRRSNIEMLLEDESADYVVASRGQVTRPTLEQRRGFLGPYLKRTAFEEYRDAIEPVVTVSNDGTLGWVVVQVQARGVQTGPDGKKATIAFTSAWIELYEKRKGRWLRTGNVSNFKE